MVAIPYGGTGFAMLDLWEAVRSGWLASCPDGPLSVYVVLGVHANREQLAWPNFTTIAKEGGISKSSVGPALNWLKEREMIQIVEFGSRKRYRVRMVVKASAVTIRHSIVYDGVWAALTPTARKVYLTLQAFSLPGFDPFTFESSKPEDWRNAVMDGLNIESGRHVHLKDAGTSRLAEFCGVVDRTIRMAMNELKGNGLVVFPNDEEVLLLPNFIDAWYPEIISDTKQSMTSRPNLTPGAKRSLTARRRRLAQTEQSVPKKGIPKVEEKSPFSQGEIPPHSPGPNLNPGGANGTQRLCKRNAGPQ